MLGSSGTLVVVFCLIEEMEIRMYRDDELAATLQMQKIEAKLIEELRKPEPQLRYWRHSYFNPLLITGLFYCVAILFYVIAGQDFLASFEYSPDISMWALWLGPLLAAFVGALFVGLQRLFAWIRVNDFYKRYGPPPKNLKPTDRISLLEGRLEELKELSQTIQQGE
jgi:hypothetical protein